VDTGLGFGLLNDGLVKVLALRVLHGAGDLTLPAADAPFWIDKDCSHMSYLHFVFGVPPLVNLDDGFLGALVEADSALQAFFRIDERVTIDHGDCLVGTYVHAGLAAAAFLNVHLKHIQSSSLWILYLLEQALAFVPESGRHPRNGGFG
jgi:hypothetical protein